MPFAVEPSTEISHRTDFSQLCNARGLMRAVEIGVDLGINAKDFLSRWHGHWLIGVDPYESHGDVPGSDRTCDMMTALQALAPWHGRFRLFRTASLNLARHWPLWIGRPQFVYLDGCHGFAAVLADCEAWWDLLEPNGILAGHDWDDRLPEVAQAVTEFARARGLVVRITHETAESEMRSWYLYRTEPDTLYQRFYSLGEAPNTHAVRGA